LKGAVAIRAFRYCDVAQIVSDFSSDGPETRLPRSLELSSTYARR